MKTFGERLKEWRTSKAMTQAELAMLLGVHYTTLRRWETEKIFPGPYHRKKLVELGFRVPPQPGEVELITRSSSTMTEHPSTYFVQEGEHLDKERQRLAAQDFMTTHAMGGVLTEQPHPEQFERILDVACGSGGWLLRVANEFPAATLIGTDISKKMMDSARSEAKELGMSDRVEFRVMDALKRLDFQDGYFDLVNTRFPESFLRAWENGIEWGKFFAELARVTKREGIVRITVSTLPQSNSPMMNWFWEFGQQAAIKAGYLFDEAPTATAGHIARLLKQYTPLEHIQEVVWPQRYETGKGLHHLYVDDVSHLFQLTPQFWGRFVKLPDDLEERYTQMLVEIEQPGFYVDWPLHTFWGRKL